MLALDAKKSYILISTDIQAQAKKIQEELNPYRVVLFIRENFLIEDAKAVIAEAYISESETKYIILAASSFTSISQNSLLKVLEEPPKNIEFIIISPSKSGILSTIRSRLPVIQGEKERNMLEIDLNLAKLDYAQIFDFLKKHAKIQKSEAKTLIESLFYRATVIDKLILSSAQLENFDKAYRLLELNSRPQSILAMIVMSFVSQ